MLRPLLIAALLFAAACEGPADPAAAPDRAGPGHPGKADALDAPTDILSVQGHDTWTDPPPEGGSAEWQTVRAWVDARVANRRFEKRVLVEVDAPYDNGAHLRTLQAAAFRAQNGDGTERWGTDAIEIYVDGGPDGASLAGPVAFRLRLQDDLDGDGADEMIYTDWAPLYGEGDFVPPPDDPWRGLDSPARADGDAPALSVSFAPFDDPGVVVRREIDRVIAAQRDLPEERHTIHAAIFNLDDREIIDRLIAAHQAGVEVRLVTDAKKLRPSATWMTGDDRLLIAGVPLLGVMRPGSGAMHDKIGLFDGRRLTTGSFNWQTGARVENHENLLLSDHAELVAAYAHRFEILAGQAQRARAHAKDPGAEVWVGFGPDEAPHRQMGRLIDQAHDTLHIAMFTAKAFQYEDGGRTASLFEKLVAAADRGVEVIVVTDFGIAEAAEYFGVMSEDDQTDEWLEARGVHVVRADNTFAQYASMHHKFAVIDGEIAVTGALNWYYDAAFRNDEDLLVVRDAALAARYTGELVDLLRRYDPGFEPDHWPKGEIAISAHHDGTRYGETVVLVGDLPELGAWDPAAGVALDPTSWPAWTGGFELPAGVRFEWKLVTLDPDGRPRFESGANRLSQAPLPGEPLTLSVSWR